MTSEGSVASYIHAGGKIGVLVEVNCESDFVARTDDFKELVHDIAMHIAASDPKFVRKEDVTPEAYRAREGHLSAPRRLPAGSRRTSRRRWSPARWKSSTRRSACWSSPSSRTRPSAISQLIATKIGKLGENIAVRRFARFKVGDTGETVAFTTPRATAARTQRSREVARHVRFRRPGSTTSAALSGRPELQQFGIDG